MEKLLICGDSFAADWTVKYEGKGWPNLLSDYFEITNLAQAGCSEYKIYKQLTSVDLTKYDRIILSHTSPYRIPIETHPVHYKDKLHKNSDLIYNDIKEHSKKNNKLISIVEFFENYFDVEYAIFTHTLLCEKIDTLLRHVSDKVLHVTNIDWTDLYEFQPMLNFEFLFDSNRGLLNHYNQEGNNIVFKTILNQWGISSVG